MDLLIDLSSDIDECSSFHGCQEKCINTVGDYHCSCSKGYRLKDNKRTCRGNYCYMYLKKKETPVNPFSEFCIPVITV